MLKIAIQKQKLKKVHLFQLNSYYSSMSLKKKNTFTAIVSNDSIKYFIVHNAKKK